MHFLALKLYLVCWETSNSSHHKMWDWQEGPVDKELDTA